MVDRGKGPDYTDLARLGFFTRARLIQIMDLLLSLQKEQNMALVLITHDLAVVAEIMDLLLLAPEIQESISNPNPATFQPYAICAGWSSTSTGTSSESS